jgi:hypothetical protein
VAQSVWRMTTGWGSSAGRVENVHFSISCRQAPIQGVQSSLSLSLFAAEKSCKVVKLSTSASTFLSRLPGVVRTCLGAATNSPVHSH